MKSSQLDESLPRCALCAQPLSAKDAEVCRSAPQRFSGQWLCSAHQRRFSACPAVRRV